LEIPIELSKSLVRTLGKVSLFENPNIKYFKVIKVINDTKESSILSKFESINSEIESIKRKYKQIEENEWFCAICLDKRHVIKSRNKRIVSTNCGHVFCKDCLVNALRVRNVCPTCAEPMIHKTVDSLVCYHEIYV
jgi:hypothetical protein